eukprot:s4891_g2.t1
MFGSCQFSLGTMLRHAEIHPVQTFSCWLHRQDLVLFWKAPFGHAIVLAVVNTLLPRTLTSPRRFQCECHVRHATSCPVVLSCLKNVNLPWAFPIMAWVLAKTPCFMTSLYPSDGFGQLLADLNAALAGSWGKNICQKERFYRLRMTLTDRSSKVAQLLFGVT